MTSPRRAYRALIHLYPAPFRRHYGEDLVQHFDDLVSDRGVRSAWARAGLDLAVTVPRYQLERFMTEMQSNTVLHATVALLTIAGVATLTMDSRIGIVLLVVGLALGLTQRSALASSFRVSNTSLRRKRLGTAGVLAAIFVLSSGIFLLTVGDSWTITDTLLALVGTPAMIAAPLFLLAGLLTPRRPDGEDLAAR